MTDVDLSFALEIAGEIDYVTSPQLREVLLVLVAASSAEEVVVDLSQVTFIDASGLRPLLEAQAVLRADGRRMRLRAVSPWVQRIIEIAEATDELRLPPASPRARLAAAASS